jgi:plastocyanin
MKNSLILLAVTIILVGVCGCTQTAPVDQPPAKITSPSQTSQPLPLTVTSIPVPRTTSSVSANTINITNFAFDPDSITVNLGSTVRWVNRDSVPHRILFADGADSKILAPSQSWSRKFDGTGTFDYACTIHPAMQGTVIVE